MEAIIVAVIGALATIVTAAIGKKRFSDERKRADQAETEIKFQVTTLDFDGFFQEWCEIQEELKSLCEDTVIDRFLLLRAFNGSECPKWTNAVFQYRQGGEKPISYIHVTLDYDYVTRLKTLLQRGQIFFRVDDVDDSLIQKIYQSEKIKCAVWYHIASYDILGTKSRMIAYCSFASHESEEIPPEVMTRCRLLANRFRLIADSLASDAVPVE